MLAENSREEILRALPEEAKLVFELEKLKLIDRQNPLGLADRREQDAEHSWHVALSVFLLAGYSPEPIDVGRAVLLATIHDVVEAFAGDTFAFGPDVKGKEAREHAAMDELRSRSEAPVIQKLVDLWEEYEAQATPEARFVKGMDAFLPIVLNFSNIENSSWLDHGVYADQVRKRLDKIRGAIGSLAEINDQMINRAQIDGYLK